MSKIDKIIYFQNRDQRTSVCSGSIYGDFIDYAFQYADFFMLVYVNYYGKGYTTIMKEFMKKLEKYKVKSRSNPCWPGTPYTYSHNTTYKIVFYHTTLEARDILKTVDALNTWSSPSYPQDLAFFKKNQCWFYSVGHENIAAIIHATNSDIDFVQLKGLASRESAKPVSTCYAGYDECLVI